MDDRSEFFAVLDQLTLSQIEARIPLYDAEQLKLVEDYLRQRGKFGVQAENQDPPAATESAAVTIATKAHQLATVAVVIAIGAMLAAIIAGFAVFEALQRN